MATEKAPNVPPFVRFCTASVPMVFDNSMSYYECLCALTKFIQDLVNTVNYNATQLDGLQEGFKELKDYVDNYFDNLDVQTEINNKLDEMAEGGQLATIIAQFLAAAPVFGYHTIAEMAAATNLANGCIARVIGNTVAANGDGAYYLIRTVDPSDDPDGVNLVAIGATLVGVRVQDAVYNAISAAIENVEDEIDNKYNRTDNISLQNYLTYDLSNYSHYTQGSCEDETGNIYVYASDTTYNGGNILVFNKNTETLANTISTNFYHGANMVKKGNYLYVAPNKGDNDFLQYNTSNGVTTTNTTLEAETAYSECKGISDFDSTHLLVTLGDSGYNANPLSLAPYIFDITDNSYQKVTLTNSKGFGIGMFFAFQSCAYHNGHIYILMSEPNCILDFKLDGTSADLQKIYQIPRRDMLGLTIGEVESISFVPNSDIALLTAQVSENQKVAVRTLKMYYFCFESELPQSYHSQVLTEHQSYFDIVYLDGSKTSLYENGSETYPFKSFTRAVECATHSDYYTGNFIFVKSGTYKIGRVYGANCYIKAYNSSQNIVFTTGTWDLEFSNSTISFDSNEANVAFTTDETMLLSNGSNLRFRGVHTFNCAIDCTNTSILWIENGIFNYSETQKHIGAIQGAKVNVTVNDNSTYPNRTLFTLSANSVLTSNVINSVQKFDLGDQGPCWTLIQYGTHSADS